MVVLTGNSVCVLYLLILAAAYLHIYHRFREVEIGEMYRAERYLGLSPEAFMVIGIAACSILFWLALRRMKARFVALIVVVLILSIWLLVASNTFGTTVP